MAVPESRDNSSTRRLRLLAAHIAHKEEPPSGLGAVPTLSTSGAGLLKGYDVIVVGAGSAGCVLAARLSEDPKVSVLLIEAGGDNQCFSVRSPFFTCPNLQNSPRDWAFRTTPQGSTNDRISHWPRGKTLGGCSSINYMLYVRGDPRNYDQWAKEYGCEGWSYEEVLPYFKKSEGYTGSKGVEPDMHGAAGPLHVTGMHDGQFVSKEVSERFLKTCEENGLPTLDYNGRAQQGASFSQVTIRDGVRSDTASCFLYKNGAINRPNLHVLTGHLATKVVFEGKKAVGVELRNLAKAGQKDIVVNAKREVVLCCGAVGTPQLLMLSGVGPSQHLKEHGLGCVADLPVGENLQDHLFAPVLFPLKKGMEHLGLHDKGPIDLMKLVMNYAMNTGWACYSWVTAMCFFRSDVRKEEDGNDLQVHFVPLCAHDQAVAEANFGFKLDPKRPISDPRNHPTHGITVYPSLVRPSSVGHVRLASADPLRHPVVDPKYLQDEKDLKALVECYKFVRKVCTTGALGEVLGPEVIDESIPHAPQSEEYMKEHIRQSCLTIYHPVGTARMGRKDDPRSVVDPNLQVLGCTGLRVADASVMPDVVSGNTNAPCIMIGEKAADLIKANWSQA